MLYQLSYTHRDRYPHLASGPGTDREPELATGANPGGAAWGVLPSEAIVPGDVPARARGLPVM